MHRRKRKKNPERKEQIEEQINNCGHCKILSDIIKQQNRTAKYWDQRKALFLHYDTYVGKPTLYYLM